jgi:hypothetical protein
MVLRLGYATGWLLGIFDQASQLAEMALGFC